MTRLHSEIVAALNLWPWTFECLPDTCRDLQGQRHFQNDTNILFSLSAALILARPGDNAMPQLESRPRPGCTHAGQG